jgi:hypothetical protein
VTTTLTDRSASASIGRTASRAWSVDRRRSTTYAVLVVAILLAQVVSATAFKDYLERDRGKHCMTCPRIRDAVSSRIRAPIEF